MSFSAIINGGYTYGRKSNLSAKRIFNKKKEFTRDICDRLDLVDIECNDALNVIKSRDTKESFFYIDPPYFNADMGHYKGYSLQDFTDLLDVLAKIKGKFLLSSYPSDILEKHTKKNKWLQQSIELTVVATNKTRNKKKTEVFTANYDIQKIPNTLNGKDIILNKVTLLKSKALRIRFSFVKK